MARALLKHTVKDAAGQVIQGAAVNVYRQGTTTAPYGSMFNAKSGGSSVTNPLVSNAQGEIQVWLDTPQPVDLQVTDNSDLAFYPSTPTQLLTWTTFTESADVLPAVEDIPTMVNVKAYGATGDGVTDDATAVLAAIAAAEVVGGGVYFGPGTYVLGTSVQTTNSATLEVHLVGAGIDVTTIKCKAATALDPVLALRCNGSVRDMTVDGNAVAVNVLVGLTAGVVNVDRMDFIRVKVKNGKPTGTAWVFQVWDQSESFRISECHINDVIVEGPSSVDHDAFAIASVDTAYVSNLTLRDLARSPNFYKAHRVFVDGMYVKNIPGFASFVVDSDVDRAEFSKVHVDSASTHVLVLADDVKFIGGYYDCPIRLGDSGASATPIVTLQGVTLRQVALYGAGPSRLEMDNCDVICTASEGAAIWDVRDGGSTQSNLHIKGSRFDVTNAVGTRWLGSFNGTTWANSLLAHNRLVGGSTIFNITRASTMVLRGNQGLTPDGVATIAVGASAFTYTNNDGVPEAVYISGGTVSLIKKNTRTIFTNTDNTVWLEPGESVEVTYSVLPTMEKDRK